MRLDRMTMNLDEQIGKRKAPIQKSGPGKAGKGATEGLQDEGLLTKEEGAFLLKVARGSIEHFLKTGKKLELKPSDMPRSGRLVDDGACFVTLYKGKGKALRGCIGTLEANRPLVFDVIDNSLNSAFSDPRFPSVKQDELADIAIEISVLTTPKKLEAKDSKELLEKLVPRKHGLILQKGWARATFLPIVWDELKGKEDFLSHLCMKAGLGPDEWKDAGKMEFFVYQAQEFEEK
jgi:AmmeMemoRadiSam system protein A